ncbi:MAG TPA: hypothetical protein DHV28_04415 [Ignavibacteriales bacterium]|nr:hypothetical protein [Ignavibacteriales bacterium]
MDKCKRITNKRNVCGFLNQHKHNPANLENKQPEFIYRLITIIIFIISISTYLIAQEKTVEPADTSRVVQDIKDYSEKDNFFSKILKSIIVVDDEQQSQIIPPDPDKKIIKKYTGKFIRKINVEILDVFGASVNNPQDTVRSWLQDIGNDLHINSKEWLIKNKLIFLEGQRFIPFYILESERIIRESPYVYDVRIIPQLIENNADSVDIMVYVQDIWSLNGSASYSPGNKTGSFSIDDINFLGYGNKFSGGLNFDRKLTQGWDWDASYTYDNIERTFLSANIYYESDMNTEKYGVSIGRDFFSPIISWAGSIEQNWVNTRYPEILNSSGLIETVRYNEQAYWLGHSFNLKQIDSSGENQISFNLSGRITRSVYSQKPEFDTLNLFQDNTFYLGRIGYSSRQYYQDHYIFGLGKTEDIPLVHMIAFLYGYEVGSNSSRPYYGLKTGYSFNNNSLGYCYGGFQIGAFRSNQKWLNLTYIMEVMYFSNLNVVGKWKWRHYIESRYSYSYDPLRPQGILNINNESGIRGFSDDYLKGAKKLVMNYEVDIFAPLQFLGFKLAFITFADFGLISSNNNSLFTSKLYQGYGIGFRIKNEHLIFPAFQFMFGFYPNTSKADGSNFYAFHQSAIYYRFNKFEFSIPSIVKIE